MKHVTLLAVVLLALACGSTIAEPEPKTEEEKTFYAIGASVGANLALLRLTEAELAFVKAGMTDSVLKRPVKVDAAAYRPQMQELTQSRRAAGAAETKKIGEGFIDKAVAEEGAVRTESGLAIKMIKEGDGPNPTPSDVVEVHYTGRLMDGSVFDTSLEAQPRQFQLSAVIKCWTEGFQKLKPGAKAELFCPSDLAYGDAGRPKIPPGSTLVFEIDFLRIVPVQSEGTPQQ